MEDIRIAAHKKASEFHINYVTNLSGKYERPMLEVGMRHIQFAVEKIFFAFYFILTIIQAFLFLVGLQEKNLILYSLF